MYAGITPSHTNPDYVWPAPAKKSGIDNLPINWENILDQINKTLPPALDIDMPIVSNCEWTMDSGGETVYWNPRDSSKDILFRWHGTTYKITPGSTTEEIVYWDTDFTDQFLGTSIASVATAGDNWPVYVMKDGVGSPAVGIKLLHFGLALGGTLRADAYEELRQTLPWGPYGDSADTTHPVVFDFELPGESTAVINVKLYMNIKPFRAMSTGATSGGAETKTSKSSPATDTTSGSAGHYSTTDTYSGGDNTEYAQANLDYTEYENYEGNHRHGVSEQSPYHRHGYSHTHQQHLQDHDHDFTLPAHTHDIDLPDHVHSLTFGIYENNPSVTVDVKIDNGAGYGAAIATYSSDQSGVDITNYITLDNKISGEYPKHIKFEVTGLCKIVARVLANVDITA